MSDNGCRENICTYGVKLFVVLFGVIGIIFSIVAAESCDFISFIDTDGNPPEMAEDPPFDTALAASVGIFRYSITDAYTEDIGGGGDTSTITTNAGCVSYEYMFFEQTGYPSIATAQFCALIAPMLAVAGLLANLVDFCICNFNGSNMFGSLFLIGACMLSAGTFLLVADPAFCFEDSELECTVGSGVYYSIGSTIFYFISSILLFCAPQADPFCYNFGFKTKNSKTETAKPERKRRRSRSGDDGKEVLQAPQAIPHTTTIVNIMIDDDTKIKKQNSSSITTKSKKQKEKKQKENDDDDDDDNEVTEVPQSIPHSTTTGNIMIDDDTKIKKQNSSNITTKSKKQREKKQKEKKKQTA